jgi:RNA 2',3'-cyclic 3'-phosphodiesterase
VAGDERIRLFCALLLPDAALDALEAWQRAQLPPAGRGGPRLVERENLHVTLAFLGSRPAAEVDDIGAALRGSAAAAAPVLLRPSRYRETRSVGMIVMDDLEGAGAALADDLGRRLEAAGAYRREQRRWLAHVTVWRFREQPRLRPASPPQGNIRSVRCALYRSTLGPGGARYEVLQSVALGGR